MRMNRRKYLLLGGLVFCLILTALTEDARAIPVFARKYKTSCATCHEVFPRLNANGEAFRLNGFQFADDELYIKDEPVELGDEAYKRLWPEALWPSDIPGLPLIATRVIHDFKWDTGGTDSSRTDFDFPHEIELFAAGALGETLSFFSEIEFEHEHPSFDAWLGFNDLLGVENAFNVKVGNIMGSDAGLFTHRDGRRWTRNDYLYADYDFGAVGSLNTWDVRHGQPGVELSGFDRSLFYSVGVLEGESALSEKDFFGQIAYKIGGVGFDGSGADLGEDELKVSTESWRDDSLTLSAWYHSGTRLVLGTAVEDEFSRVAAGLLYRTGDLQLGGGVFSGENDDPFGTASTASVDSDGYFAESTYFYKPWLIPTVRFETRDLDMPSGGVGGAAEHQDLGRVIASVKFVLRANVSLTLEQRIMTTDQATTRNRGSAGDRPGLDDENMFWARLDFAF